MATLPKQRLSSRVLQISLTVALASVIFYGLSVFAIEFQSGLKDARMEMINRLKELTAAFNREVQRRQTRVRLLTENPQAFDAAVQSIRRSKKPEAFFGDGVRFYQILHQTELEAGGATSLEFESLLTGSRHGVLKLVEGVDTDARAGLLFEAHAMAANRVQSIRVLWNVDALLPAVDWMSSQRVEGLALVRENGKPLWLAGQWPRGEAGLAVSAAPSEFSWDGKTWILVTEEISIFSDPVHLRAIAPKSLLYAQAWRMSRRFLNRVFVLLAIGLALAGLLVVATRQVMKPLDEVTRGVNRIADGDLDTVLETSGDDEIAFLSGQLNDLVHRLKVKEQSVQAHIQLLKEKNDELQALSDKLKEADRLKDQFLAILSHELRTPLTAILGYAELSLEGIYGPLTQKQTEIVTFIHSNGQKLLTLMEDLLDIAKIRAGTIEINIEPLDPYDLMADIRKYAENSVRAKSDVRFVEDIHAGLPGIRTDRVKLEQILTNLLSNAIKFTERGHVALSVTREGDSRVKFTVEDTGIGIAPAHLPKIFDPFVQLDAGVRRRYGGTGLGLTICKSLVDKLGGRIEVESIPGSGSRFSVWMPVDSRPAHDSSGGQAA